MFAINLTHRNRRLSLVSCCCWPTNEKKKSLTQTVQFLLIWFDSILISDWKEMPTMSSSEEWLPSGKKKVNTIFLFCLLKSKRWVCEKVAKRRKRATFCHIEKPFRKRFITFLHYIMQLKIFMDFCFGFCDNEAVLEVKLRSIQYFCSAFQFLAVAQSHCSSFTYSYAHG